MGVAATAALSMAIAIALFMSCGATQYTVGDTSGWDSTTNFNSWVQGKTFAVGDILNFQYSSLHSVLEVSKSDYDSCQTGNALQSYTDGSTNIPLTRPGNKYFICGTPGHCSGGMKMAIDVQSAATNGGSPTTGSASPFTPVSGLAPVSNSPHAQSSAGTSTHVAASGAAVVVVALSLFI